MFGTNGTLKHALTHLSARMQTHDNAAAKKAAAFQDNTAAQKAAAVHAHTKPDSKHTIANTVSGAKQIRTSGTSAQPMSADCVLRNPTAAFPACRIPIHDTITLDGGDAEMRRLRCSTHNCSGLHCELRDVCVSWHNEVVCSV